MKQKNGCQSGASGPLTCACVCQSHVTGLRCFRVQLEKRKRDFWLVELSGGLQSEIAGEKKGGTRKYEAHYHANHFRSYHKMCLKQLNSSQR